MKPIIATILLCAAALATPAQAHHETGCADTNPAGTPEFNDTCYHEFLLYNMDQPEVDIVILPSSSPYALRDMQLMEESVAEWDEGINDLADPWLANGLNLNLYRAGLDNIPPEVLYDVEVYIVPAEFNPVLLFGIGLEPIGFFAGGSPCHGRPPPFLVEENVPDTQGALDEVDIMTGIGAMMKDEEFHLHDGADWGMLMTECEYGGTTCFVINTNFLFLPDAQNARDMYDLNSHELGHCLGIGHVGDAGDFTAAAYPVNDIMSYSTDNVNPLRVLCVSTLNILALEHIYGDILLPETDPYPTFPAGLFVHMPANDWSDTRSSSTTCPLQPSAVLVDTTIVTDELPTPGAGGPLGELGLDRPVCSVVVPILFGGPCPQPGWGTNNIVDENVANLDRRLGGVLCQFVPGSPEELGC